MAWLTFLAGCSPPVGLTVANKDPSYGGKLSRVLVIMALRQEFLSASQNESLIRDFEIRQALADSWAPLGVEVQVVDVNDREATAQALAVFAPTQALTLALKHVSTRSFVVATYSIDASVFDVPTGKRVWRATIDFAEFMKGGHFRTGPLGTAITHQAEANNLAKVLTEKFKAEALL